MYTDQFKGRPGPTFLRLPRIKRHKRSCIYYSNTIASFHLPLIGDLVFKLNPGPVDNNSRTTISRHGICSTRTTLPTHNTGNPNATPRNTNNLINLLPSFKTGFNFHKQMVLYNINAHYVRKKTAVILLLHMLTQN